MFKVIKTLVKETKMIFIVRTDLKMGRGKIAGQCAHAAVSLYAAASTSNRADLNHWLSTGQQKIVLKIDDNCEENLIKLYDLAKGQGLNACLVRDAGKTQVIQGSLTVLGIGPNSSTDVDKITSNLKLL